MEGSARRAARVPLADLVSPKRRAEVALEPTIWACVAMVLRSPVRYIMYSQTMNAPQASERAIVVLTMLAIVSLVRIRDPRAEFIAPLRCRHAPASTAVS